jgi:hypothetical protein
MHDRDQEWSTADGRRVKIRDITDGHLINVVNWILDNYRLYPAGILETMVAEAKYRQTFLFAEGKSYPQQVGERWKLIDPQTGIGTIEKPPADYIEAVKDNAGYQTMSKHTQRKRAIQKVNNDKQI